MNDLINIQNHDGQLTVSSREIAANFEKEHKNVVRDIESLGSGGTLNFEQTQNLFIESKYQHEQNKQWYKEYQITRDGFSLLVMGFTGARALEWKLKYIEAFNQMEDKLQKPASIEDLIILQAQSIKDVKEQVNTIDAKVKSVGNKLTNALNTLAWQSEMNTTINQLCESNGLSPLYFRGQLYHELESTARCNLESRRARLRERMKESGSTYDEREAITKIDVIERDSKLKLIFEGIVRKYQIKYAG